VAGGKQNANWPRRGRRQSLRVAGSMVRTDHCSVDSSCGPREAVSGVEPAPFGLAGGELDYVAGAAAERGAEGLEVPDNLDDHLVGVDEGDVDREEQERRVNRPAWPQDDPVAGTEFATAEQAPQAPKRRVRHQAALADDLAVVFAT